MLSSDNHLTCLQCAQSKVRCDKEFPCGRCKKRGTVCTPQTRKRGRTQDNSSHWIVDDDSYDEEEVASHQKCAPPRMNSPPRTSTAAESSLADDTHIASPAEVARPAARLAGAQTDFSYNFLVLTNQWLTEEPPLEENHRAVIALQSFIQGSLNNEQALNLALKICGSLRIDGAECVRWCLSQRIMDDDSQRETHRLPRDSCPPNNTYVLDVAHMRLPAFIDALISHGGAPAFVYAYHNGHETYSTNAAW